jgi:hypothetical protein
MVHKMVNIWFVINNYQHTIKTNNHKVTNSFKMLIIATNVIIT